ncbi:hypothetical protein [Streptomyces composti]|uniref:hypothetical protein n=1 Tax=Streptomyces composti TaxID=2720025 RepID=UPI0028117EDD|nr:hypothetical protein [Streptomyces composti]
MTCRRRPRLTATRTVPSSSVPPRRSPSPFAGAGVGFSGASQSDMDWLIPKSSKRSTGPDKPNQPHHALFLQAPEGVRAHVLKQRALLHPKFELVQQILEREPGGTGLARWTSPKGGYVMRLVGYKQLLPQ